MGKTSIEWTDASWNPIVGCTEVSPGCANCYAAKLAGTRLKNLPDYMGLADKRRGEHHWIGGVRFLPDRLREPQQWIKPRRIFVCDMGDLFHESVQHGQLLQVFEAMAAAPQHTYQLLTKRAGRMREWLTNFALVEKHHPLRDDCRWPWPNVWCGVSVENQHFADERIPLLLETPAAVRFISAEPLLGAVDLALLSDGGNALRGHLMAPPASAEFPLGKPSRLDWVICGGESGPGARPMHPDWARSLRDQCVSASVPFFFKQWGAWLHADQLRVDGAGLTDEQIDAMPKSTLVRDHGHGNLYFKVGKKKAGRLLDGREWSEFPQMIRWEGVMQRCEQ